MPVKVSQDLPAVDILKNENIFVMGDSRASQQDIRPLKIAVVNLMPIKVQTETDLLRLISNTPLQVEIDLVQMSGHVSKNTPAEHLEMFYKHFNDIKSSNYDGLIITGAPVELVDFEQVDYWNELTEIMDWSKSHVTSTLYICWAAFAGMYHNYGINKYISNKKISGVYKHKIMDRLNPLFRGFDDEFFVPHSRFTYFERSEVEANTELKIIAESEKAGIYIIQAKSGKEFYITGHSEYSPNTLDKEYHRDLGKGMNPLIPENYYVNDNPDGDIIVRWRAHANLLFSNWLNYFVYQITPYNLSEING